MAPSPPPTGLLHQSAGTGVLGNLPSRLVTEDTPPDMLAGSMDLLVTLPQGKTVKMSVERSTPMMDLLVHITTAHKVSPGGHVLQAWGDHGTLPYKPSTPIGALDTWSICVVPRHQAGLTQQAVSGAVKRAPPKPLSLQGQQPFEQTFRLQVRLPRNQLYVARRSPRTPLADILEHVCREKNLDPNKYELRHPVNTDQPLQLSLSLADYRVTEVVLVPRGSRAPTELSSLDIPALQSRNEESLVVSDDSHQQRANGSSTASTGSGGGGGIFANMLKRTRSGGGKEGSVSGDSLGGRSSSPARSDESVGRSISPPGQSMAAPQQPPPPPRHRKGRAPKPPIPAPVPSGTKSNASESTLAPSAAEDCTLVYSHSRNSSDSSGYHEASVLSESPDNHNHVRQIDSPPQTLVSGKGSKGSNKNGDLSQSLTNSEASTSQQVSQKLSNAHSASTSSLTGKKKRAPAPPPPKFSAEAEPAVPVQDEPASNAASNIVLEPVRPNPAPRTRLKNPLAEKTFQESMTPEPPKVKPRLIKHTGSSDKFKKSSLSRAMKEISKVIEKQKSVESTKNASSRHSSIGSSSSLFGVGKSLLAMNSSQEIASDNEDDIDLAMFEGGQDAAEDNISSSEDQDAFEKFHSIISTKKRNSITQIIRKSNDQSPTQKTPKPVGYRVRPKLDNVEWKTVDNESIDETSQLDPTQSEQNFTLARGGSEDQKPEAEGDFNFFLSRSDSTGFNTTINQWFTSEGVNDTALSGDGTNSDSESTLNEEEVKQDNEEDDSAGEDDLDSAFQSVTDVLEEQLRVEAELKESSKQNVETESEEETHEKEAVSSQEENMATEEPIKTVEWLQAEEEKRKAEEERKRYEEERARLAQEREELARQRQQQQALEQQLRQRLQQELEEKQRAIQEEQRREIIKLQKEQEELERELRERELERLKRDEALSKRVFEPEIVDIQDWDSKLPAPPTEFRDAQVNLPAENGVVRSDIDEEDDRISIKSANSGHSEDVEVRNKINNMTENSRGNEQEGRPKPPAVVDVKVKAAIVSEVPKRSYSPPNVTVVPLRSAHSLYSLVHADDNTSLQTNVKERELSKSSQNLKKTSSAVDVSRSVGEEEEARLQQLQQQFIHWQEQLISNQTVLQGHVPLQSLQVLREILPQMKQKLSEESNENEEDVTVRPNTLPRPPKTTTTKAAVATLDRRPVPAAVRPQQRYSPPTINLGTWSERPKSEVTIKHDSDYRIGVGQHQNQASRAPVVKSAEPKLKDTTNIISGGDAVTNNSWRNNVVHKPSIVTIQNLQSASATEQVRASNKPKVILRHQPVSMTEAPSVARYTTFVGVNKPQTSNNNNNKSFSEINQQRITIKQTSNPVVKGFKFETDTAKPPPPPVIRNFTQKKSTVNITAQTTNDASDRNELMDAIRNFGGRSNLKKTRSMQF